MKKREELNILLLSMSILNRPEESYYGTVEYIGKRGTWKYLFRGISQLEAGTKYYIRTLEDDGQRKLDKIFIVASEKAREGFKHSKSSKDQSKIQALLYDSENVEELSATTFYQERIKDYINGYEIPDEEKWLDTNFKSKEEKENHSVLEKQVTEFELSRKTVAYLYPHINSLFEEIKVNDEVLTNMGKEWTEEDEKRQDQAIYKSVYELCQKLRELVKKNEDKEIHIYLDMQGARRYESFVINAALKMLENTGIRVTASTAIDFVPANNAQGKFNRIVKTTINDRIFEMVSGMNEFLNTGRGDTFRNFANRVKKEGLLAFDAEEGIIEGICNISDAISLCDINRFEQGLRAFSKTLMDYEKVDLKQKNAYFMTFIEDLKTDYENFGVLVGQGNKIKTVNQINWCKSKGLYQQAITLIEAWMPQEIFHKRILYCSGDLDEIFQRIIKQHPEFVSGLSYLTDANDTKIKKEHWALMLFKYLLKVDQDKNVLRIKYVDVEVPCSSSIYKLRELYFRLTGIRNDINHAKGIHQSDLTESVRKEIEKQITEFTDIYQALGIEDGVDLREILETCFCVEEEKNRICINISQYALSDWEDDMKDSVSDKLKSKYGFEGEIVNCNLKDKINFNVKDEGKLRKQMNDIGKLLLESNPQYVLFYITPFIMEKENQNKVPFSYLVRLADSLKEQGIQLLEIYGKSKAKIEIREY